MAGRPLDDDLPANDPLSVSAITLVRRATLVPHLGSSGHHLLRIWGREYAAIADLGERPPDDAIAVEQELADELTQAGRHHLLIRFSDVVTVFSVQILERRKRIHRLRHFA